MTDNEQKISELVPAMQEPTRRFIDQAMSQFGYNLRINEGYRSNEKQAYYYAQGRTSPGKIVTYAKPGESLHNTRRAFDVVERKRGYDIDWNALGKLGKSMGFVWGGDFPKLVDRPHFEWRGPEQVLQSVSAPEDNVDLPLEQFKAIWITWFTAWPSDEDIAKWRESGKLPWQYMQEDKGVVFHKYTQTAVAEYGVSQYEPISETLYRKIN